MARMAGCHPDRKHKAKGLCKVCYQIALLKVSKHNKEWQKEYYRKKVEFFRAKSKLWREANKNNLEHKKLKNYHSAKRRAAKLQATIAGYNEELKAIYTNCPKGYHVDHIIPLQGKEVCGLHVPWNLQYLTAEENYKKGNKLEVFLGI